MMMMTIAMITVVLVIVGVFDAGLEGNKLANLNKAICIYVPAKDMTTNCVQVHYACSDWTNHACSSNDSTEYHVSDYNC
jgi:hypothetical protein